MVLLSSLSSSESRTVAMGFFTFLEGLLAGNICGGFEQTYHVLNKTTSTSDLANELRKRPVNQNARLIGVHQIPYFNESPILAKISSGRTQCLPGKTYVIWARAENGKSAALQDFIANEVGAVRDGLYIKANKSFNIVEALQKTLNTTCDSGDIVEALVAALSSKQRETGVRRPTALLVIDEVNFADRLSPDGAATASFIQDLFQTIAEDRSTTCIIASNKENTANFLVNLNGRKIKPHPSFTTAAWTLGQDVAWDDVRWTVQQLQALLRLKYPTSTVDFDFLRDGMTPGDAISTLEYKLDEVLLT